MHPKWHQAFQGAFQSHHTALSLRLGSGVPFWWRLWFLWAEYSGVSLAGAAQNRRMANSDFSPFSRGTDVGFVNSATSSRGL